MMPRPHSTTRQRATSGLDAAARALARLATVAALALPLACVNPFKPADPEIGGGGISVPENFNTSDDLLETVELAIAAKAGGASAYLHAFAESTQTGDRAFRALYDPAVRQGWEGGSLTAPEPWDVSYERGLHTYIAGIRQQDSYTFKFIVDNQNLGLDEFPADSDTGIVHRRYQLLSKSPTSGSDTQGEIIAIGICDLSMQQRGGRWSIFRWVDHLDPAVGVNPAATDQRTFSWWRLKSLSRD